MQESKDTLCDFLLVRMWRSWLDQKMYDVDQDYDLIDNENYVSNFIEYLYYSLAITKSDLKQFEINDVSDMQHTLRMAFDNIGNSFIM